MRYLGRAFRTKETLPDFRKRCRVTRHSRIFRGLMGSKRTPGFWGVNAITSLLFTYGLNQNHCLLAKLIACFSDMVYSQNH